MPTFQTDTDIANAALNFLGQGPIADLGAAPDTSDKVLTSLQTWYSTAVEMVIRDLNFELASQFVIPALILPWPTPEWKAAYYLDPSWLKFVRVLSGSYPDSRETEVPHRKIHCPAQNGGDGVNISAISFENPAIFTTVEPLANGQVVEVTGVNGTQIGALASLLNNNEFFVGNAQTVDGVNTCELYSLIPVTPAQITEPDFTNCLPVTGNIVNLIIGVLAFQTSNQVPYQVNLNGTLYTYTPTSGQTVAEVTAAFLALLQTDPGYVSGEIGMVQGGGGDNLITLTSQPGAPAFTLAITEGGANFQYSSTSASVSGGLATPLDHERLLCNMLPSQYFAGGTVPQQAPQFEVGVVPDVSLWPADFAVAVAKKLAHLAGVGIVGIDHMDQIEKLGGDYITAKQNAAANMGDESFKGVRKLSATTLSRMVRRRWWGPRGGLQGYI
jgi:hypothetical protein